MLLSYTKLRIFSFNFNNEGYVCVCVWRCVCMCELKVVENEEYYQDIDRIGAETQLTGKQVSSGHL